jgi:XTP/dITP diphosphohydrolase
MSTRILLASNNGHKLAEFRGILTPQGVEVVSPADAGISLDVAETGSTFEENARLKADAFCRVADMVAVADDSGLVVDALGGEPGIRSARYAGSGASDADRIELVLQKLRGVPTVQRTARFVAAIALARPGLDTVIFRGEVEGLICSEPRGSFGFGYDPIFYYPSRGRTFGELQPEVKAEVSHRGRALAALGHFLRAQPRNGILGWH